MAKKQKKATKRLREFLEYEITALDTISVNKDSPELLKVAAPDTYQVMKAYFERRLNDVEKE